LKNPILSILIATHNSELYIEDCIKSLVSQNIPRSDYEIIVIDDGSNDNSVDLAKKTGADLVIQTDSCSIGKARNIGFQNSKGKFIGIIDSDCRANKDWISSIIDSLQSHHAVCGPVINGNTQSNISWAEYFLEFAYFNDKKTKSPIRFMPGCNGALTKEVFLKVGGYADIRASEDVLMGDSLKRSGINIYFIPKMSLKHYGRTTLPKLKKNLEMLGRYFVRNRRQAPTLNYPYIINNKIFVTLIFFFKIFVGAKYALQAQLGMKYFLTLPYVIMGVFSYCKGFLKEMDE
jgi:glycosyltransferase involved in cell wall biosynthesis